MWLHLMHAYKMFIPPESTIFISSIHPQQQMFNTADISSFLQETYNEAMRDPKTVVYGEQKHDQSGSKGDSGEPLRDVSSARVSSLVGGESANSSGNGSRASSIDGNSSRPSSRSFSRVSSSGGSGGATRSGTNESWTRSNNEYTSHGHNAGYNNANGNSTPKPKKASEKRNSQTQKQSYANVL
ncbi:hypothetical protein AYI70_g192 [Smittium culicis]|uniref:Uncharacterized protein n=1 Tax=Smittium culicis TaxID=133412 RepID=A0A1R1YHN7_9FUNG|nr:hypothetical protein AYI70_g192 [Smittium culicis]